MAESTALRISEAGSLAVHTAALMASQHQRICVHDIATRIHASEAHLSKVLQRLHKAGIVRSARGRGGGFSLARPPSRIALLDVYEAIDGKFGRSHCLMGRSRCAARRCILGGVLAEVDQRLWTYLSETKLSQLTDVYGGDHEDS